ncbi:MAG: hypothetical protein A3B25_02570 [Candidatus Ryanbacteria bacterium RIFCSPLOWO2_01_FULL_48_26]|uniref:Uncharacterized protein n=1 Tax=Candidatus Ryanbacteria bacterium RIFCSPLOWO2_01_FULL_48_26 TaxID=1802126 RepID=A0A1G2GVN4_9BACT|nr:MAG: hypothetical protein A3B25_02570 [Candidatus Ryanbacteria bacterium RIFCSPLOWO2_01_FULL_48_26]
MEVSLELTGQRGAHIPYKLVVNPQTEDLHPDSIDYWRDQGETLAKFLLRALPDLTLEVASKLLAKKFEGFPSTFPDV